MLNTIMAVPSNDNAPLKVTEMSIFGIILTIDTRTRALGGANHFSTPHPN